MERKELADCIVVMEPGKIRAEIPVTIIDLLVKKLESSLIKWK
ncbi:hypothetical protein [Coprococcus comes]